MEVHLINTDEILVDDLIYVAELGVSPLISPDFIQSVGVQIVDFNDDLPREIYLVPISVRSHSYSVTEGLDSFKIKSLITYRSSVPGEYLVSDETRIDLESFMSKLYEISDHSNEDPKWPVDVPTRMLY
jgi:hypothetical protein